MTQRLARWLSSFILSLRSVWQNPEAYQAAPPHQFHLPRPTTIGARRPSRGFRRRRLGLPDLRLCPAALGRQREGGWRRGRGGPSHEGHGQNAAGLRESPHPSPQSVIVASSAAPPLPPPASHEALFGQLRSSLVTAAALAPSSASWSWDITKPLALSSKVGFRGV